MDRTQLTASIAGLALVAASIVGAVVATQGPSDLVVVDDSQAQAEAVLVAQTSASTIVAEPSLVIDAGDAYVAPAEDQFEYDDAEYEEEDYEEAEYEEEAEHDEYEEAEHEESDEYEEAEHEDGEYEDHDEYEEYEEDEDDD